MFLNVRDCFVPSLIFMFFSPPFALKIANIGAGRYFWLTLKPSFVSSSCIKSRNGIIRKA